MTAAHCPKIPVSGTARVNAGRPLHGGDPAHFVVAVLATLRNALWVVLLPLFWQQAIAQSPCTVREERRWQSQTGVISVGSLTVSLTLPTQLLEGYLPKIFLDVAGSADAQAAGYSVDCCGARSPLRHGAPLALAPAKGERITFAIRTGDGRLLCTWQPSFFAWRRHGPLQAADGFARQESEMLRRRGDPVTVRIGGSETRELRIGGLPAMVLSRTPWEAILRDPHPAAGSRTVESEQYSTVLRFFDVDLRWSTPSSGGNAQLEVTSPSLGLTGRLFWPSYFYSPGGTFRHGVTFPMLRLTNFSPETVQLRCGKGEPAEGHDMDQSRTIRIGRSNVRSDGTFRTTCAVRVLQTGPRIIDVMISEPRANR